MKLYPALFVSLLAWAACVAHAQQEDASVAAERARLHAERTKVDAEFRAVEKSCYGTFAVNDCVTKARAKRRQAVSDLRHREIALNDAQRQRKAIERQRSIEERTNAARGAASHPADVDRQLRASERAAERAKQATSAPAKAAERERQVRQRQTEMSAAVQRRQEEAAKNVKERERREAEAKEREDKMKKRQAERSKAPASSLPDPK